MVIFPVVVQMCSLWGVLQALDPLLTLASALRFEEESTAQHSRYSRNERSRFFLLEAPSTAKSSHNTWLQKYYSHRHCCLCKLHKTLPLLSLEAYWCSRMFAWETCALLSSVLHLCYPSWLVEMSWLINSSLLLLFIVLVLIWTGSKDLQNSLCMCM